MEEEEESTANCPICNLEVQVELLQLELYILLEASKTHFVTLYVHCTVESQVEALEQHAATCAAAMFGS